MGEGLRKEEALFVFSINVSHPLTRLREWLTYWLIRIPFPVLCIESFFGMYCCRNFMNISTNRRTHMITATFRGADVLRMSRTLPVNSQSYSTHRPQPKRNVEMGLSY